MNFRSLAIVAICLVGVCYGKTTSHILEQWNYECTFDGERHAHEVACNRYYECRLNGGVGWVIYLYKCPEGYKYNGSINTCVPGTCNVEPVTTELPELTTTDEYETTTDSDVETTTEAEETPIPTTEEPEVTTNQEVPSTPQPEPFKCTGNGYFVDPYNCSMFHYCVCTVEEEMLFENFDFMIQLPETEAECSDNVFNCPAGFHFCESVQSCANNNYCQCKSSLF